MSNSMSSIIARYMHIISTEIQNIDSSIRQPLDRREVHSSTSADNVASMERNVLAIDVAMADVVGPGTILFPHTDSEPETNWLIFSQNSMENGEDTGLFSLYGTIDGASDPQLFVEEAYRYILMREIDPTGRNIYPHLIVSNQLSRRDVLKMLSESEEARSLRAKLIIIPQSSSWLSRLDISSFDDLRTVTLSTNIED